MILNCRLVTRNAKNSIADHIEADMGNLSCNNVRLSCIREMVNVREKNTKQTLANILRVTKCITLCSCAVWNEGFLNQLLATLFRNY